MQKTNVLIIGAGPTGLMAACQLQRYNINYIIIDKKEGPTKESRALILHARSLEIFDQMEIAEEAIEQGEIIQKAQFIVRNKKVQEVRLGAIGRGLSPFPFLLVLEQSKNEELLSKYLQDNGGEVLWKTEMRSLEKDNDKVLVVVQNNNSEKSVIQADYVIAADGGRSSVRDVLNIPFEGGTYEHIFYVADTKLDWQWGHDKLSIYLHKQTFLGLFPMKGEKRFRAIGILPPSYQNEHPETFEEIIPHIQKQVKIPLKFSDTDWFSVYRLHHRCIQHFRNDRVFFAGDAAHIHSPAGGQGMNTGLQDAYNLAWKLAFVIKGLAKEDLLSTYDQERLPFAKQLIASTDRAFAIITSVKWYNRLFRMRIMPIFFSLLFRLKRTRFRIFKTISQIGIRYISSDLTVNRVTKLLNVKAGERFPYLTTKEGTSVYNMLKEPLFHALVFSKKKQSKLATEASEMETEFRKMVKVIDMTNEEKIIKKLKISTDTVILVRPDNYIGLITDEGIKVAKDYLKKLQPEAESSREL